MTNLPFQAELSSKIKQDSLLWKSLNLNQRQLCDLELILNGGFAPLVGFMKSADYESVCSTSRLADSSVWPIPVVLDVSNSFADSIRIGEKIALRDLQGVMLAALTVEDIWQPNKIEEAHAVYGSDNLEHPGVRYLINNTNPIYIGGKIEFVGLPVHHDFNELRHTPGDLKSVFKDKSWDKIIAFQTRNPLHKAHFELIKASAEEHSANILIHPAVGMTKPGDVDYFTRVRCYRAVMPEFDNAMLSLLPLAMRMAGPREAIWHALIRKNYSCTHFIIGRDHASPGRDSKGNLFYTQEQYSEILNKLSAELNIEIVQSNEVVYVEDKKRYYPIDKVPEGTKYKNISGTELRSALEEGKELPDWYTFPAVDKELRKTFNKKNEKGTVVFLTGLPSAGKSTVAEVLLIKLLEKGLNKVTLLDGDEVRKHLSTELGFSKEHRDLNIRRIGYVASEIAKCGGIAICAPIAPYDSIRKEVKEMIQSSSNFFLVYVDTPLAICEQRDRKGLYAKAKAGILKGLTGIDDPYEVPEDADLVIDTTLLSADQSADLIIQKMNI